MAINFNKLFLQNLLPKGQSTTHTQVSTFSSSEATFENVRSQDYTDSKEVDGSVETTDQQERETERLSHTLECLRLLIDNHNRRRVRHKESPTLQLRAPPSMQQEPRVADQPKHRRNTLSHQPYQVDAAPACKDLSHHSVLRTNERMSKKSEKVTVEVRVVFLKIGEIDTLKEMFRADAFIQTKWPEPRLNGKTDEELAKMDLSKCWNPLVYIENILTESKDQHWISAKNDDAGQVFVTERRRLRAIFLETLELNDFPLDVQDLTITLSSERPDTEVELVPDSTDLCGINLQTLVDQQEWRLHEHIEITRQSIVQEFTTSSQKHPCISVTCRAARRPGYFYWNVFLIMFFITGLSFATFSVSAERPENRLQLSFTLFLTSVAFKFVINQSLPKISYLTFMDKYVLMSLGILCKVSVWHAIVTLVPVYSLPDPSLPNATGITWDISSLFHCSWPSAATATADPKQFNTQLLDLFGQLPLINASLHSYNNLPILLPRNMIPPWMNKSFTEALRTDIYDSGMGDAERDLAVLQRAIDLTLKRRLWERQVFLKQRQVELKKLEDERTALLNRVERDVFIIFCIFYFACHLVFIFSFYFGAHKRRREMVERDKQFRVWLRKRRENPSSSGPQPFIKVGPCIAQRV
ncbi:Gamma-aminobutyric acid receptor subunit gamma-2 [Echinococcus granulosus]|uniref:Gamma aminobutyric acid receptor subunit n=1 Tax=Echinococcus granulosus TaxID=6210 RepID=A0A068WC98_ECHGR|nr:Gamma-aminobutyric acid receptor subunit gamma-2 [Echinococcus granulosus]CDS17717.1 gamma aminobutyric acid receptor subunit [Echinococcus granulosus]